MTLVDDAAVQSPGRSTLGRDGTRDCDDRKDEGKAKRIEHIAATLSLPTLTAPLTGTGTLDWKEQTVAFNFTLTSLAELREKRPAKLLLAVDTPAIAGQFDGSMLTRPDFSGEVWRKGAMQVENVASGSVTPRSVPATLAV